MASEVTVEAMDIDHEMAEAAAQVDWHKVTEAEAASFGLAVSFYREVVQAWLLRRAQWGTAVGGVISMAVLSIVCMLCHTSGWFALMVIIGSQVVRALWLYLKSYRAARVCGQFEQQCIDVVGELAQLHPYQEPSAPAAAPAGQ